ncbi:MAG: hypothetical protein KBT29_04935, partial [Prevotellaceae bacterium]|nr:hypothetical protein [Candidatus Minthosoma caballi]
QKVILYNNMQGAISPKFFVLKIFTRVEERFDSFFRARSFGQTIHVRETHPLSMQERYRMVSKVVGIR